MKIPLFFEVFFCHWISRSSLLGQPGHNIAPHVCASGPNFSREEPLFLTLSLSWPEGSFYYENPLLFRIVFGVFVVGAG